MDFSQPIIYLLSIVINFFIDKISYVYLQYTVCTTNTIKYSCTSP